ncbi:hypothetical protein BJF93_21915 [Xaviernesmea oryzae]|uniref:Response regulatory domain-containing protein n=1 Tax=Xaviernesmea oryzae TaxID=464029 RepID=A0A1Q9AWE2_9HYPH|nr:response regulator [Xaviernesmea oryzae]OLP59773.1 hypothetical protein BJF93_21915 [Xaviernesmea oryzae]SEM10563.1 Response regulator receiver domain-containing protein [Xaviernesmea oryzae]
MNAPQPPPDKKLVLVVEDELFLALDLQKALSDGGFEVQGPAASVTSALDLIRARRPDAAVLDVTLHGEKATPVGVLLKSLVVPLVLASASDPAELARHAVFSDVLNLGKPTNLPKLVRAVRGLLAPLEDR